MLSFPQVLLIWGGLDALAAVATLMGVKKPVESLWPSLKLRMGA